MSKRNIFKYLCGLFFVAISSHGLSAEINKIAGEILKEIYNPPINSTARALKFSMLLQRAAGNLKVKTQSIKYGSTVSVNIYVELNCDNDLPVYVISSHTDTDSHRSTVIGTSGIIDNWSGCIMNVSLLASFKDIPLKNGYIFIGFGLEEKGEIGSKTFLKKISRGLRDRIKANINLECLGMSSLKTWTNRSSDDLEHLFLKAAGKTNIKVAMQSLYNFESDADSFRRKKIPAITIHSLNLLNSSYINSVYDSKDLFRMDIFTDSFNVLHELINVLDNNKSPIRMIDSQSKDKPAKYALTTIDKENGFGDGVQLASINPNSIEYRAGLRAGDIIYKINKYPVRSSQEIKSLEYTLSQGDTLDFVVKRNSSVKNFRVAY